MKNCIRLVLIFFLISICLSACKLPGRESTLPAESVAIYTAATEIVETKETLSTATQSSGEASTPIPTNTLPLSDTKPPETLTATASIIPTSTPEVLPSSTQAATSIASKSADMSVSSPTVPPTKPQYAFKIPGLNIHQCNNKPRVNFHVKNTGRVALESMELRIQNLSTPKIILTSGNVNIPFMSSDKKCKPTIDYLKPSEIGAIGGSLKDTQSGQFVRATITLCTQNELGGQCYQEIVDFIMP